MKLLFKTEFKRNSKSLLLWSGIIIGLVVLMLSLYPVFQNSFSEMEDLLNIFPEGFLKVFGINGSEGLDISTAYGWYGMEGYLFAVLIGGSYAALLGSSILSKEEDDKTIEFLLSKPISRNNILLGKGLVVFINLLLLNIAMFITLSITFLIIAPTFEFMTIFMISIGPLLLQVIFAAIAMFMSLFVTKSRTVMSASMGLVMGLYFVQIIATLTDKLNFLKYITVYEFVNNVSLINHHRIEPVYLLISAGMLLVCGVGIWYFYNKKDITI